MGDAYVVAFRPGPKGLICCFLIPRAKARGFYRNRPAQIAKITSQQHPELDDSVPAYYDRERLRDRKR
jgi:hypothetical protein